MKVLVIEDNPIDLKLAHVVLQTGGHDIDEHTSAAGVMEAIEARRPDVILLDLNLPGIDGLTLVRELQSRPETRQIPIMAMTAYPHRYRRAEVLAAGCVSCLTKPIDTRELANQLREVATGRAP